MHHICTPKRMLTGLLTVALTAIFAQSALAYSVGQNDNAFVAHQSPAGQTTTKAPLVIPYLSHGIGVDRSLFSAKSTNSSTKGPLVIPYLSHGVGVEQSLYSGSGLSHSADAEQSFNGGTTAQPSDVFTRAVIRHEAFVKAMNATAVRPDNRAGTLGIGTAATSQSQSTAVRPDDRSGLRGIGTTQVAQSASSNSGTDWSSILQFGGVVLGVLLVIAAVVALTRPRGRVLAH